MIEDLTWFLFEQEYALPLIPSTWAAVLATLAEHALPVLMIRGLLTRLSALGLLAMMGVIRVFVYPQAWLTDSLWAAALLAVAAHGLGRLSLDHLLGLDPRWPSLPLHPCRPIGSDLIWWRDHSRRPCWIRIASGTI